MHILCWVPELTCSLSPSCLMEGKAWLRLKNGEWLTEEGCSKSRGVLSMQTQNVESILPYELGGLGGTEGSDKCPEKPGWWEAWHEGL